MNELQEFMSVLEEFVGLPDEAFNESTLTEFTQTLAESFDEQALENCIDAFTKEAVTNPEFYNIKLDDVIKGLNAIRQAYLEKTENKYKQKFIITFFNNIVDLYRTAMTKAGIGQYPPVLIELCREGAKLPTYAHPSDAGADIYAPETIIVPAHSTVIVMSGLKACISPGWLLSIRPRSGMSAKTKIRVANSPSTIDSGYHLEIGVILENIGDEDYTINAGDRIAQLLMEKSYHTNFVPCEEISQFYSDDRANQEGKAGFGSTGN